MKGTRRRGGTKEERVSELQGGDDEEEERSRALNGHRAELPCQRPARGSAFPPLFLPCTPLLAPSLPLRPPATDRATHLHTEDVAEPLGEPADHVVELRVAEDARRAVREPQDGGESIQVPARELARPLDGVDGGLGRDPRLREHLAHVRREEPPVRDPVPEEHLRDRGRAPAPTTTQPSTSAQGWRAPARPGAGVRGKEGRAAGGTKASVAAAGSARRGAARGAGGPRDRAGGAHADAPC